MTDFKEFLFTEEHARSIVYLIWEMWEEINLNSFVPYGWTISEYIGVNSYLDDRF